MDNHCNQCAMLATKALLYEVALSPKPGLVDRFNNGAHHDMNYYHFIDSALALQPYFVHYVHAGYEFNGMDLVDLFTELRSIGVDAEHAMFEATKGVNTHKGANFAFAVLLGALGYHIKQSGVTVATFSQMDTEQVCHYVSKMTQKLLEQDLRHLTKENARSFGEKLYVEHGLLGPRGEAAVGYPNLIKVSLPTVRSLMQQSKNTELVYLYVLVELMSVVEDGNLIHRGGVEAWQDIQASATQILSEIKDVTELPSKIHQLDQQLIDRYLSPGGAADLLALTIFFYELENNSGEK